MRKTGDRSCFWRDQSGQAIVFGALTLFMLVLAVVVVYNVGAVVAERMRLQQAADAAATAGAQIEANAISSIAWMNDGMAYIYYNTCRYAVDVGIYGTLAELKEVGPPYPDDAIVGVSDPVGKYNEAYARAAWIPRGETMLNQISKIEAAIALATPVLIEMEVCKAAEENGAEGAAIFPKFVMFPDPGSYFILDITKIPGGWEMISDRGDEIIAQVTGEESWWISATVNGQTVDMSVDKIEEDLFRITYTDADGTKTIYIMRTPYGDIIIEGDSSLTIIHNDDGSITIIESDGTSITYRITEDGTIEVWNGEEWVPIETDESVDIDGGAQVRVDNFTHLQVGPNTWVGPNTVWIFNIRISLTDPISISGKIGIAWISVQENSAVVNGLSTANADGKWHTWWTSSGSDDTQAHDRTRHRMTELVENEEWEYEWVKAGSYLFPDNRQRFVSHALRDNDPGFQDDGVYPAWCTLYEDPEGRRGWFDMATGRPDNWESYYQRRLCWHPNEPPDYDGHWIDLDTGAMVTCPVCRAIDSDGDGRTDVMVTQRDSLNRVGTPGFDADGADRQSVNIRDFELPLVLTEDFFKFGINVGAWSRGDMTDITRGLISNPEWGMFAVSSARIGFRDPETGNFTMRFPTMEDRTDWVNKSPQNLYEPTWEFRIVSTRDAILGEDLDVIEENETGANYLYRGMADSRWRDGYYGGVNRHISGRMRNMTSPWEKRFDITARELEEVIKH